MHVARDLERGVLSEVAGLDRAGHGERRRVALALEIREINKAVDLNPNDSDTLIQKAFLSALLGQAENCLGWIDKALHLNPMPPDWYLWSLTRGFYAARRYHDVLATCADMTHPPYEVLGLVAASHGWLGQDHGAEEALQQFHARANAEMAAYPGADPAGWRRYWSNGYPYRKLSDLGHLYEGLRRAGLPL